MKEIKIKGFYGDWFPVTLDHARRFVKSLYSRMLIGDKAYKVKLIEERHLAGISFEELMQDSK